ncbi:MAG: glutamate synthase subunit beta [Candidatus Hydrogenedentota bacterium]
MFPNKEKGFMIYNRKTAGREAIEDRIQHYHEFQMELSDDELREQGYRCMNCGVPFCHQGCPLGNIIPDFNDMVKDDDWEEALDVLHSTNNFPEFTGRVCPAPCESACVLKINEPAVTIKQIERAIGDHGWDDDLIHPEPSEYKTGKKIAVVGAGPAGMAAAQQLARAGHAVVLYERDDEPGGLLMYGIPDFKLEKDRIRARQKQMEAEGVEFRCNIEIGKDVMATDLVEDFDALLLTIGSTHGRDLPIPGRDLDGIHMAMEFLPQQNKINAGKTVSNQILATDKKVVILGGGDTGSDCHGTSIRQGATEIFSIELLPKPPKKFNEHSPWPMWPMILRTSSSHEEGGSRDWSVLTKEFVGENGKVTGVKMVRLNWVTPEGGGRPEMREIADSEFIVEADLVLLALGFVHPEQTILDELELDKDPRDNVKAAYGRMGDDAYRTNHPKVWAAGDARRGQSLVVWAIHEGREAAHAIDKALMGKTDLPSINAFGYEQVTP